MRAAQTRSPRVTLDLPWRRRSADTAPASDEAPFAPVIGALVGVVLSLPLWALIVGVVLLLRR